MNRSWPQNPHIFLSKTRLNLDFCALEFFSQTGPLQSCPVCPNSLGAVTSLTLTLRLRRDSCLDTDITGIWGKVTLSSKIKNSCLLSQISVCEKLAPSPCNVWIFAKSHRKNTQECCCQGFLYRCTGSCSTQTVGTAGINVVKWKETQTQTSLRAKKALTTAQRMCTHRAAGQLARFAMPAAPTPMELWTRWENSQEDLSCCIWTGNEIRDYLFFLLKPKNSLPSYYWKQ